MNSSHLLCRDKKKNGVADVVVFVGALSGHCIQCLSCRRLVGASTLTHARTSTHACANTHAARCHRCAHAHTHACVYPHTLYVDAHAHTHKKKAAILDSLCSQNVQTMGRPLPSSGTWWTNEHSQEVYETAFRVLLFYFWSKTCTDSCIILNAYRNLPKY